MNYQIIACEQVPADSEVYQITKYDSEKTEKQELLLSTCSARVDRRLLLRWRVK